MHLIGQFQKVRKCKWAELLIQLRQFWWAHACMWVYNVVHLHKIPSFMGLKALTHVLGTSHIDYYNSWCVAWPSAYLQELQSDGMAPFKSSSEKKYENPWVLFCCVEAAPFFYSLPSIIIKVCQFVLFLASNWSEQENSYSFPALWFCENKSVISRSKPVSWWYLKACCLLPCLLNFSL